MSNRKKIIEALSRLTVATADELADATGWPERKVRDTLGDLKQAELVSAAIDDVTRRAAYRLTAKGKSQNEIKTTPAAGGANISGSQAPETRVAGGDQRADISAGGKTVVEPPKPAPKQAEACSDEILIKLEIATAQRDAWRNAAALFCIESPGELRDYITELTVRADETVGNRFFAVLESELMATPEEAMAVAIEEINDDVDRFVICACRPVGKIGYAILPIEQAA